LENERRLEEKKKKEEEKKKKIVLKKEIGMIEMILKIDEFDLCLNIYNYYLSFGKETIIKLF
jgi:hypothetical protein